MKKKMMVSALILLSLIIGACAMKTSGDKQTAYSPSEAVERFYNHARNGELDEAKKYVSTEVISYYEENANPLTGTLSFAMSDEAKRYIKVTPKEDAINGQTAIVTAQVITKNDSKFTKDYNLIKEEDGWKLLFQ